MTPTAKSIVHTIAFYDAVGGVPLTKIELYKRLIPAESLDAIAFSDFLKILDGEWDGPAGLSAYIARKRGFYFLKKNSHGYAKRINEGKTGIKKWRIAKRMARLISFLPHVRMVAVTGSLALYTTNKNSDIDMLIAARGGHIWTTRVFVSMLTHLLGKRRHGKLIRDRICLNHYISDKNLLLRPEHLFSAHICSSFIPVWDKDEIGKNLVTTNAPWTKPYFPYSADGNKLNLNTLSHKPRFLYSIAYFFEYILTKTISARIEAFLRSLQMRKMNYKFIADDTALVFHHPRPQNQEALHLYQKNLRQMNLPHRQAGLSVMS